MFKRRRRRESVHRKPHTHLWSVTPDHPGCAICLDLTSAAIGLASALNNGHAPVREGEHGVTVQRLDVVVAYDGMMGTVSHGDNAAVLIVDDAQTHNKS